MHRNFIVRFWCSILLLFIAGIGLLFFHSIPFKIFYCLTSFVASIELFSFFFKKKSFFHFILLALELILLILGTIFIIQSNNTTIILLLIGVCSYDIFAYLFGRGIDGYFFPHSHPFPHISKNKTWEGTIMGLISSFTIINLSLLITHNYNFIFLLAGPFALIGDLSESLLKRYFSIKDSNEIIIKKPGFAFIELLVGGKEGHGGYLDRIDSIAFTATIFLILSIL